MEFLDQMGNRVHLAHIPRRIISLVPSFTELLFDLGLDKELVGVTRQCILPENKAGSKPKIGDVKDFDFMMIDSLRPELIIGNKEENYKEGIVKLQKKYPVWMSDITTLVDALEMIRSVGGLVGRPGEAGALALEISTGLNSLDLRPRVKAAYLIWNDPCMAAGGMTFINEMLERCGLYNVFADRNRYPVISVEDLAAAEVILLSSEPWSFSAAEKRVFRHEFPDKKVLDVDGLMFSWYGSHLRFSAEYFIDLHKRCLQNR
jgi:ABC-type Fe3+-hydroxamate transport system substrate-binding protein